MKIDDLILLVGLGLVTAGTALEFGAAIAAITAGALLIAITMFAIFMRGGR